MGKIDQKSKQNIRNTLKTVVHFVLNPKLILCFILAWMITNGWAYVMLGFGFYLDISWMQVVAGTYLGLIWIPMTPEKIITVAISIFLLKFLFPKDERTLGVLISLKNKLISSSKEKKKKNKEDGVQ